MEPMTYKKSADLGSLCPKMRWLDLKRGNTWLAGMRCSWQSNKKLRIVLDIINISKEELEDLRVLHGSVCREMKVSIITNRAPSGASSSISQERYKQLVNVVLGKCNSIEKLALQFRTKQDELSSPEFLTSLEKRGALFPSLKSFKIKGVDAFRMMESLGAEGAEEGMNELRGTWDEKAGKWKVEGFL